MTLEQAIANWQRSEKRLEEFKERRAPDCIVQLEEKIASKRFETVLSVYFKNHHKTPDQLIA